jgi:hypothetical protein
MRVTCGGPAAVVVSPGTVVTLTVVTEADVGTGADVAAGAVVLPGTVVADDVGVAVGVEAALPLAVGLAVAAAAAVTLVVRVVRHVTVLPPGLPVPLHWLTRTAMAGVTVDAEETMQSTVAPPPLADPLHCVTVAFVVVAGNGEQFTVPPPPPPDPTHWLTVAAVTGCAPGVSALMLLVIVTRQVIGCAASLSEPLHWFTDVTRLVELLVKVPLPEGQGSKEHWRVSVVVDDVVPELIVLTTVTSHVIPVVAPPGPGPTLLH